MPVKVLCAILPFSAWDLVAMAAAQAALLDHDVETIC